MFPVNNMIITGGLNPYIFGSYCDMFITVQERSGFLTDYFAL
jgi:hypothetical protein